MNILVTGSNGFIGSHLVSKLIELGHTVNDYGYDTIIHLAAVTTLSTEFNAKLFDSNIVYANEIMKFKGRIIYASSTSAAELTNPYAYTKRYLEYLGSKHGNAVGLRFFNVYGNGNNKGIIKKAIECANSGDTIFVHGGEQVRDFIYIDDVVRLIIESLEWDPGIYDIGTGVGTTIDDAISEVASVFNKTIYTRHFDKSSVDMDFSVSSIVRPECLTLEQGLKMMI